MAAAQRKSKVYVVGVGMTKFTKPGSTGKDYPDLVKEAVTTALNDCGLKYDQVQQAAVGYLYGSSCCAQRSLYDVGMTGIPIFNVNNACASGSSALYLMKQAIESGAVDCALAAGFEKMAKGSLENMGGRLDDRAQPVERHVGVMSETYGLVAAPLTAQMFGMAGKEHMEKYGTKPEHFAKIAYKNHKHSVNNPNAQFQKEYSLDQVQGSKKIYEYLTMLQCSPTSDGSAAAIVVSERFLERNPQLKKRAVEIVGMELGTDFPSSFNEKSNIKMVGFDIIRDKAAKLYRETGLGPNDVQVIECHDCFAPNELLTYEALGLCPIGKGGELVDRGDNTYGGKWVVNPSGGLISKGHPIGATGVAQCVELTKHLRNEAGPRQVPNSRVALQHNIGIGSAGVVALYRMAFPSTTPGTLQRSLSDSATGGFKSDEIFEQIQKRVAQDPSAVPKTTKGKFRFVLTHGPSKQSKEWLLDLNSSPAFVGQKEGNADVTITAKDADFHAMANGKLNPQQAFMQGKMKLKGNMMLAMKLRDILDAAKAKL